MLLAGETGRPDRSTRAYFEVPARASEGSEMIHVASRLVAGRRLYIAKEAECRISCLDATHSSGDFGAADWQLHTAGK